MLSLGNKLSLTTQPIYKFVNEHSVDFDGVDDRIVTDGADTVAQPTTYSFWCKTSTTTQNTVFGHGASNQGGFSFNYVNQPLLFLGSGHLRYWQDNSAQDDGEWHHWVVYSDTNDITNCKLYIDSVLQTPVSTTVGTVAAYTESLTIGGDEISGGNYFEGKIDEFAVYDRELTQAEITRMYNTYYSPNRVANGNFSQIGNEEVTNGDFSQIGSEQVTNGDFATDSDWTKGGGITISGGSANFTGVANANINQNAGLITGKIYKIVFTVSNYVSGDIDYNVGGSTRQGAISSNGTYTDYVESSTGNLLYFQSDQTNGFVGSIDNVSVKEVGQDWSFGTGWSMGDGVANADVTSTAALSQSLTGLTVNGIYDVTITISNYVTGGLQPQFGGTLASPTGATSNGTHNFKIVAGGSTQGLLLYALNTSKFTIDNISIKEVGQHWTFGTGWSTDGTKAIFTATGSYSNLIQTGAIAGRTYKMTFDATRSAGTLYVKAGSNGTFTAISSDGSYSISSIAAGDTNFYFQADTTFAGTVDNIVVQELKHDATNLMLNAGAYQSANPLITSTKSMEFDGTDDYLNVSNAFNYISDFSLAVWLKAESTHSNYEAIISKYSGNTGYDMIMGLGKIRMAVRGSSNIDTGNVGNDLRDGNWHYVVAAVTNSSIKIYTDGALTNTTTGTWTPTTNTANFKIGFRDGIDEFNGKMTEVGTWDRELTSLEVASLYNQGMPTNLLVNRNNYQSGNPTVFNTKQVDFDGASDFLDLGSKSATSSLTYSAWVKLTNNSPGTILQIGKTALRFADATNLNWWSDIQETKLVTTLSAAVHNVWSHIVVTQTGQNAVVYLNGVQVNSSSSQAVVSTSSNDSAIGKYVSLDTWHFPGEMSQVGVWNEALTADEVSSLYNHGLPIDLTTDQAAYASSFNLTGYWRMGSGTLDTYPLIADQTNATLGSELIVNGDFATDSNWTLSSGITRNSNGYLDFDGTQGSGTAKNTPNITFVQGKVYKVIYEISNYTSGTIKFRFQSGNNTIGTQKSGNGVKTEYIVCNDSSNNNFQFFGSSSFIGSINNVSVKQVQGNPAIMTNQTSSDIENGSPYANILQNGDFSNGTTNWNFTDATGTVGTYFGISEVCQVEFTNSVTIYAWQSSVLTSGKSYKVTLDYYIPSTNVSVNNMDIKLGNTSSTSLSPQLDVLDAWTSVTLYGTADGVGFYIYRVNGTIGDKVYIDNVSVAETNTGLQGYWKMGDGTNDEYPVIYDQVDPTLGSELVTNGNFATETDWTFTNVGFSAGAITFNASSDNVFQNFSNTVGKTYKLVVTKTGSGTPRYRTGFSGSDGTTTNFPTSNIVYFTATSDTNRIQIYGTGGGDFVLNSVSVVEVQGNLATMTNMVEGNITNQYPLTKIRNYYRMGDGILDGYPIIQDQTSPNLAHIPTTNLVTYSEDFSQSYWIKAGITETDNYAIAPDGTQTAARLVIANADPYLHNQTADLSVVAGTTYTFSYYEKGVGNTIGKTSRAFIWYLGTATGSANLTNFTLTGDWERREISFTPTGSGTVSVRVDTVNASIVVGEETLIWGWQVEAQSQATAYIKSDGIAAVRKSSTTNTIEYSEDFSQSSWLKTSGVTITSNYGTSPIGTNNSTRLQLTTNQQIYNSITHSGNTETASIYVKGTNGETIQFGVGANIAQGNTYTLNGEWQRINHQSTSGSIFIVGNKDATATDFEIWGAQFEEQTQAETYAKTTGLPVTISLFTENNYGTMTNMSASDIVEDTP